MKQESHDFSRVECQPGYDIVTRGVFYCARMLSAQCDTEFVPKNYDDIKKVYSIWICMEVPQEMEYTLTKYRMTKEDVYGVTLDKARYDLLELVMVCLGRENMASKGNELHGLLSTLLSETLEPIEKKEILKQKYKIETSVELEGGLFNMCNLSDLVEERALKRERITKIQTMIRKGYSKEDILELDYTEDEYVEAESELFQMA